MTAENWARQTTWARLEQGRSAKAERGGYAGYGSPAFGQQAVDGELISESARTTSDRADSPPSQIGKASATDCRLAEPPGVYNQARASMASDLGETSVRSAVWQNL